MTGSIDGMAKTEIMYFRENMRKHSPSSTSSRNCEYCGKDLTNETSRYSSDITQRVGFQKYETKTIEYCLACKSDRNM